MKNNLIKSGVNIFLKSFYKIFVFLPILPFLVIIFVFSTFFVQVKMPESRRNDIITYLDRNYIDFINENQIISYFTKDNCQEISFYNNNSSFFYRKGKGCATQNLEIENQRLKDKTSQILMKLDEYLIGNYKISFIANSSYSNTNVERKINIGVASSSDIDRGKYTEFDLDYYPDLENNSDKKNLYLVDTGYPKWLQKVSKF
jgi:hypothetical protein